MKTRRWRHGDMKRHLAKLAGGLALMAAAALAPAQDAPTLSAGQTLYLPIYSHLYHGDVN